MSSDKWDGKYPVRCRIIDADGKDVGVPGMVGRTPDKSQPHIGKCGTAELSGDGMTVRITLDDGTILWGHECWWTPLPQEPDMRSDQ